MILLATTIATFMVPFDGSVVNLALPAIGHSLHAQLSFLVWLPASYFLVTAVFQAPTGRLADLRGRKDVFAFGIAVFTVGSVLASLSPSILILIVNRIIQGLGGAMMSACSIAVVTDAFRNDRGKALGINTSAVYSGLSFGPVMGAVLVEFTGWRSIFYVNVPIGIIALILVLLYVPKDTEVQPKRPFDMAGSILLGLFLSAAMLLLSQAELSLSMFETVSLGIITVTSLTGLVVMEDKFAKDPVLDLELFTRNRLFTAGNLTAIFNYTTNQGTLLVISLYLQLVHGYSPISAALFLVAQPIVQAITSVFAGVLSDRSDARLLSSIGIAARAVGLFALSFLTINSSPESVWIPMAIVGFGHGMFSPPNTNSIMSSVEKNKRGIASGIIGTVRTTSNSAGLVVMTAIIAGSMPPGSFATTTAAIGLITGSLAQGFVIGMHYAFLFAGGFSAIGILTSLVRGKEERFNSSELKSSDPELGT
jgi:EmrB/QacA subfamily drug resistance transporter